jgi:hypothetical protein
MSVDYQLAGRSLVCRIMTENNRRLSRTHHGHSEVGASAEKLPLLLAGSALRDQAERNGLEVCRLVHAQSSAALVRSEVDIRKLLLELADRTNQGLLPAGRYRTWHIGANQPSITGGPAVSGPEPRIPPEKIQEALNDLCHKLWQDWSDLVRDPVPVAAWAEWQVGGGPLHPFYDGCGRISRAFASALLVRGGHLLPLFDESERYFSAGNRGMESFLTYYKSRVTACHEWIGAQHVL